MEENKIVGKEVKMGVLKAGEDINAANSKAPQKLSYEQLNQACADMSQQLQNQGDYIQKMRAQIQQMGYALQTKRVDYLFKVLEISYGNSHSEYACFSKEFVEGCVAEIQDALTIKAEPEDSKED